jgi:hypothetical protein
MALIAVIEGSVERSVMVSAERKRNDVLLRRMAAVAVTSATATATSASAPGYCLRALALLAMNSRPALLGVTATSIDKGKQRLELSETNFV